jgi:YHS domain-containing protein
MKTKLMWGGSLLLAVVIVAGCESKEKQSSSRSSSEHPTAAKSDHPAGKKCEHPTGKKCEHPTGKTSAASTAQTTCPIMGGKIIKSVYGDHDGKRVYFCCAGCNDAFSKEPMKYIKILEDAGVVLEKTPS